MNTYIISYANDQSVWIDKVRARSYNDAKNKFMEKSVNSWDIDVPADWEDYKQILRDEGILIGKIYDVEEL